MGAHPKGLGRQRHERGNAVVNDIVRLVKPDICILGYAMFLAVNATGIWGGVFLFLPMEIQTADVMFWFYLAQSVMLFAVFFTVGLSTFFSRRMNLRPSLRVIISAGVYFTGWAFLIGAMYLDAWVRLLAVFGGLFLGVGAALFYLLWQRLFAGGGEESGMRDLILAFMYSAVFYAALYLVPRAVTAYLIPLVFLPLFALALIIGSRRIDYGQPMFADEPHENLRVYRAALTSMWRGAVSMGALAFCTGIMRALAVEQPEIGSTVNILSMAALFASALVVLLFWQFKGVHMNLIKLFRIMFPVLISAFFLLPFLGAAYSRWLAALLYALYSIGLLLMSIQCAQTARDRGVNPSFVFGVYGGIVYGLHDLGFIVGSVTDMVQVPGMEQLTFTAVLAMYLLAIMFFVSVVDFRDTAHQLFYGDTIELVAPRRKPAPAAAPVPAVAAEGAHAVVPGAGDGTQRRPAGPAQTKRTRSDDGQVYRDRIDKQVALAREAYGLSMREAEVVSLIMRGNTVARIAELLFISENTVRTHTKRIYAKLDVHKKAELIALVEEAR